MSEVELNLLAEKVASKIIEEFKSSSTTSTEGDFSIAQIRNILGIGDGAAYGSQYHGEYRHNGRRLVRREEFLYRRKQGLDVCIRKE